LADGATEISGAMPVNTDGGLIANGEPIGASGLGRSRMVRQLRGQAGERQVPGTPRVGFAQVTVRREPLRNHPVDLSGLRNLLGR